MHTTAKLAKLMKVRPQKSIAAAYTKVLAGIQCMLVVTANVVHAHQGIYHQPLAFYLQWKPLTQLLDHSYSTVETKSATVI